MIVLDTNIISELMKTSPSTNVINWIDRQDVLSLMVTTVTIAEISYGITSRPKGKRRNILQEAFSKTMIEGFTNRVLHFNQEAAYQYGNIMSMRKKIGFPLSILDGQIASIAFSSNAILATRNIKVFHKLGIKLGIELVNPFI